MKEHNPNRAHVEEQIARAVIAYQPTDDMPDRMEMLEAAYARAQVEVAHEKTEKAARRRSNFRRGILVACAALVIVVASTVIGVLAPPPTAVADTWFDKVVMALRSAFRIEVTPEDSGLIEDSDSITREFSSVSDMQAEGIMSYVPTYIPADYQIDKTTVVTNDLDTTITFYLSDGNDGSTILIRYLQGKNLVVDTPHDEEDRNTPVIEGIFSGVIVEYESGYIVLSCVSESKDEMIAISGMISIDESRIILQGMERTL